MRVLAVAVALLAALPLVAASLPPGGEVRGIFDVPRDAGPEAPSDSWAVDPTVVVKPYRLGLDFPVAIQLLDDGRIFYGEWQTGRVNILHPDGSVTNFADLDVLTGGEMGLHEVSYHAVGGTNYVYVSYVYGQDSFWGCVLCRDRLSRFEEVSPGVAGQEQVLLDLPGGFVHNGGIIAWGPLDGKLYYSRGDISNAGLSQQLNGHAGRVMRLNPDGTIPGDNPLGAGNPAFAYGLRHTFGMDFVPHTQVLVTDENGPDHNDEVNLLLPGRNYGWPTVQCGLPNARHMGPLRCFFTTIGPTNGHFYTGSKVPQWTGQYFYGDTNNGRIYRFVPHEPQADGPGEPLTEVVVDTPFLVIDLQTGPDGYLYFTRPEGIYRIEPKVDTPLPGARLG